MGHLNTWELKGILRLNEPEANVEAGGLEGEPPAGTVEGPTVLA